MERLSTILAKFMLANRIRPGGRAFGQNIEEAEKPPPLQDFNDTIDL